MRDLLAKEEMSGRLWTGFLEDRSMGKEMGKQVEILHFRSEIGTIV